MPAQNVSDAWRGWSANHDHIGEILAEFIDNALALRISNPALPDEISISWEWDNANPDVVVLTIKDQLGGMADPVAAWTVGNQQNQVGPLNEHGYGFKHSIAAANPGNDGWEFWSRTQQQIDNDEFSFYKAPYSWDTEPETINRQNLTDSNGDPVGDWPGDSGPGTVFKFNCDTAKFKGLRSALGTGGVPPEDPKAYVTRIEAYLGFLYGPSIQDGNIAIVITPNGTYTDENGAIKHFCRVRDACYPYSHDIYHQQVGGRWVPIQGNGTWAFDGVHDIPYKYEAIRVDPPPEIDWRKPFYQRNRKNAGLEIRLNGRVLAYGLFDSSIFGVAPHPLFNAFVFRIDILADETNKMYIPSTKTTKSGMQTTSELLELYACVQNHCPNMDIFKTARENTTEANMRDHLVSVLNGQGTAAAPVVVQSEYEVWDNTRLDIHLTGQGTRPRTEAYECKKGRATALNLYQLIMYCDGLREQGTTPDLGTLVANQFAPDVVNIINAFNASGYHTQLRHASWESLTGRTDEPYADNNPLVG